MTPHARPVVLVGGPDDGFQDAILHVADPVEFIVVAWCDTCCRRHTRPPARDVDEDTGLALYELDNPNAATLIYRHIDVDDLADEVFVAAMLDYAVTIGGG